MSYEYDVLAFIGRFGPFHAGHKSVVDRALSMAKKVALVLGSANQPRTVRNPWTATERAQMISAVYPQEVRDGRIQFLMQEDHPYNLDRWIAEVQAKVITVANTPFTPDPINIGLIGHSKDESSFYLKCFPTWGSVEAENFLDINATDIRSSLFSQRELTQAMAELLPRKVAQYIYGFKYVNNPDAVGPQDDWVWSGAFDHLVKEYDFLAKYKKQWAGSPYPPVFFTADAVVVQSGHVLLVKRSAMPGEGLWALPGGFVNEHEDSKEAAIRELKEETRIDMPVQALRGSIGMQRLFQDPYRSQRGRTVSMAYLFNLRQNKLPKVKGGDDAAKAQWVPIANLNREHMFEDHYDICETMIGF